MSPLEVLKAMRSRVAQGWTQRAMARDANGVPCEPDSPQACAWCVFGAGIATGASQPERLAVYAHLLSHTESENPSRHFVDAINDFPGRTKDQILSWIDRAIASLQSGAS